MHKYRRRFVVLFQEKEDLEKRLRSLEELHTRGEIGEDQYSSLRVEYENKITDCKIRIEELKSEIEKDILKKRVDKNSIEKQIEYLTSKMNIGEITSEVHRRETERLRKQVKNVEKEILDLQILLSVESLDDLKKEEEKFETGTRGYFIGPATINLGDVISSPFHLLKENWQLLVPLGISVLVGIIMAIAGMGINVGGTGYSAIIGLGAATFIAIIVDLIISAWVCSMIREIDQTGGTSIETSFSAIGESIIDVILGAILVGVIVFVGTLCFVIPGIILGIALCAVTPAIVKYKLNPVEGLKVSWRFCWQGKNFWRLFVLLLIIGIVGSIPVIGNLLSAFIFPLWIPYAYVRYD